MLRGFMLGLACGLLTTPLPLAMALATRMFCALQAGLVPSPPHGDESAGFTEVHVMYSSNSDYFAALLVSMISLAQHLRSPSLCSIHLIVPAIELAAAKELVECFLQEVSDAERAAPKVFVHALQPLPFSIEKFRPFNGKHNQSEMLYARLYAGNYIPDVGRVLYLDSDVIVKADIGPLYRMRMEHTIAARPTPWMTYLQCWGLDVMKERWSRTSLRNSCSTQV